MNTWSLFPDACLVAAWNENIDSESPVLSVNIINPYNLSEFIFTIRRLQMLHINIFLD